MSMPSSTPITKIFFAPILQVWMILWSTSLLPTTALPDQVFWDNDWSSDLSPTSASPNDVLEGTVLFAQSQIIPSKNGIPDDDQPRLTALRKALVMFQPHTFQDDSVSLELKVRDKDGTVVSGENPIVMDAPEDIPKQDGWFDLGKVDIDFPASLDNQHVVGGQENLDAIEGSEESNDALADIFNEINTHVEIKTWDGSWISSIHLPEASLVPTNSMLQLTCDSTFSITIHYSSVNGWIHRSLSTNESLIIIVSNGVWIADGDPKPDYVPEFPSSVESPYVVKGQTNLNEIGNDSSALGLLQILNDDTKTPTNEVEIKTWNGSWIKSIFLPDGSSVASDSKVQISCGSSWGVDVYYPNEQTGGIRKRTVSEGENLVFILLPHNRAWIAQGDLEHNEYVFGHNFYSTSLLAEWVQPGMTLEFAASSGEKGMLAADVGGFTELLITTLDAGFLTEPRDEFTFRDDPTSNREYYETTMASRLIVAQYESLHLTEVMMPTGVLYDTESDDEGGVHSGDMRQSIGKILLSHGIDLANYGISSSFAQSERPHPYTCALMAAHNTVGMYQNGRVVHGLSGGNGMITLKASTGNEMSHEVGHNYGLGHYVEGFSGSVHRPANEINSSWGWDSTKNIFIPNFSPTDTAKVQCLDDICESPFLGKYQFGKDAMAGGSPLWGANRYTLYTPNVSKRIQKFLESRAIWDPSSTTGFSKYNPVSGEMEDFTNEANGKKIPRLYRVPVTTIVGYYEPDMERGLESYIYPAMHGAFGYVYDDDGGSTSGSPNGCELVVETSKDTLVFSLDTSIDPKGMNKFHVNIPTAEEPNDAKIYCQNVMRARRALDKPREDKPPLTFTVNGIDFDDTITEEDAPTPSPTSVSSDPVTCVDREDLKFGKKKRNCAWIAKRNNKKKKQLCKKKKWKKKTIRDYWCPSTCATVGFGPCSANESAILQV